MAKQTINPGVAPTGAGGDTFRSGSAKLQANDDEIYNYLGDGTNLNKLGTAATRNAGTSYGNVMEVGAFGIGAMQDLRNLSFASAAPFINKGAMVGLLSGEQINIPSIPTTNAIIMHNWVDSSVNATVLAMSGQGIFYRFAQGDIWGPSHKLLSNQNTSTDSNGFIKAASPIVKLFADRIELNDEAQQQDISFEKLGVGDYLIKGSSGFAQEGWYIETPKDANGNVLFSVIYATLKNGDISVKTYKKKFDFETVSIVADLDNPVDITENRWIDLRLQELPQPEIEIPESIAPPDFQPTGLAQAVATVMESYHDPEQ